MLTFFLSSQRRASVSILLIIIFYLLNVTFLKYITLFRNIFRPTLVHICLPSPDKVWYVHVAREIGKKKLILCCMKEVLIIYLQATS